MATTIHRMNEKPPFYHSEQDRRDATIATERRRKEMQETYENTLAKNPGHILGLKDVMAHFSKPYPETFEPHLSKKVPTQKKREELFKKFFQYNIWDVEPTLLDELSAAHESQNRDRIDNTRQMIRAASWMTHKRTDAKVAVETAREKANLILREHEIYHAMLTEEGFEKESRSVDSDLIGIKQVIEDLESFRSIGKDTEHSLRYVESAIEHDWDTFLQTIQEEKSDWPENPGIELTGKTADLADRIEAWRIIRDQLYFQRYNENLSKIGQLHSEQKNPFA